MIEIKQKARELGFELVGIASAEDPMLSGAIERYETWLQKGYGATMDYLSRHKEQKAQPARLLPEWKSVICVGLLYGASDEKENKDDGDRALVSLYTRGEDYHELIEKKLRELGTYVEAVCAGAKTRPFVDSSPVFDRFWAWRAGLGWLGKNSMLINRKVGSYVFLGGLLTTAELSPDAPQPDHCGRCRKCIEACPTEAITENRELDSRRCIAYHTIENRGEIPKDVMENSGRWIAGCDICQTVCPWNDPITPGLAFKQDNRAYDAPLTKLAEWSAEEFKSYTRGVAMNRMKYAGFMRNVSVAIANSDLSADKKFESLNQISERADALPDGPGRQGAMSALNWAKEKLGQKSGIENE